MRRTLATAAFGALLALPCVTSAAPAPNLHAGHQLTQDNFDDTVAHGPWFIEFFSPYCGHCRHFAPTWKELVESTRTTSDVQFGQVDCAAYGDLCDQHNVAAYPTLKLYQHGIEARRYEDEREIEMIEAFLGRYAAKATAHVPPVQNVSTEAPTEVSAPLVIQTRAINQEGDVLVLDAATLGQAASGDLGPTFVKFYAPWCGHCKAMAPAWKDLAGELRNKVNVAEMDCDSPVNRPLCREHKVKAFPTLILFASGQRKEYLGARSTGSMRDFAMRSVISSGLQDLPAGGIDAARVANEVFFVYVTPTGTKDEAAVDTAARSLFGSAPVYRSSETKFLPSWIALQHTSLVVFKSPLYDPLAHLPLQPDETSETIADWLRDWRVPLVAELRGSTVHDLLQDGSGQRVVLAALDAQAQTSQLPLLRALASGWANRGESAGPTRFYWADPERLKTWLKATYGIKVAGGGGSPPVVLIEPSTERYYDRDLNGAPFSLDTSDTLFDALEAHSLGKLRGARYSRSTVDRAAEAVGRKAHRLLTAIGQHALLAALCAVGIFVGTCVCLARLVDGSERPRPYAKKD